MNNKLCDSIDLLSDHPTVMAPITDVLVSLGITADSKLFISGSLKELSDKPKGNTVLAKLFDNQDNFLNELSHLSQESKPPTVLISNSYDSDSISQAVAAGADAVITESPNDVNISSAIRFATANNAAKRQIAKELKKTQRRLVERAEIERAKYFLMLEHNMSEQEAHALIRSNAMENCTSMGKAALKILEDLGE